MQRELGKQEPKQQDNNIHALNIQSSRDEENTRMVDDDKIHQESNFKVYHCYIQVPTVTLLKNILKSKELALAINIVFPILVFVSFLIMRNSIQDCPYDKQESCAKFVNNLVNNNMNMYISIGGVFAITILLSIKGIVSHKTGVATFIFLIYIVRFYDNNVSLKHYGGAITSLVGVFSGIWFLSLCIILGLYKCFVKSRWLTVFLIILALISARHYYSRTCDGWIDGMLGEYIIQTHDYCLVMEPQECPMGMISKVMDLSKILRNCQNSKGDKNIYLNFFQNIDPQERYVAMPKTNKFTEKERVCQLHVTNAFQFSNFRHTKNVQSPDQAWEQGHEIVLDMEEMQYLMNVKRNATLVKERLENQVHFNGFSQKVMVVYVDALSRVDFHRSMPKVRSWFENRHLKGEGKTVEFFRMYSLKPYTYPNFMSFKYECYAEDRQWNYQTHPCHSSQVPLIPEEERDPNDIYSNYLDQSTMDEQCRNKPANKLFNDNRYYYQYDHRFREKERNIFKDFRDAGYVIGRTVGMCMANMAAINEDHPNFYWDETADHEGSSFSCDPNYEDPYYSYGLISGPYSILKRCLNGQTVSEHMIQYGRQFWEQYKDDKAFMLFEFIDSHEPSGSVIGHLDEPLFNFLTDLENKGYLDDTLVIMMSDHGNHMHFVQSIMNAQQFHSERMFPVFLVNFPKQFIEQHPEKYLHVNENQQKMFTHKNTHFFLHTWIKGMNYQNSKRSFFNPDFNQYRSCQEAVMDWDDMIDDYGHRSICVCIEWGDPYPDTAEDQRVREQRQQ